ncbi:unnamed protein product, partial [Larinioides sclopetarius]
FVNISSKLLEKLLKIIFPCFLDSYYKVIIFFLLKKRK